MKYFVIAAVLSVGINAAALADSTGSLQTLSLHTLDKSGALLSGARCTLNNKLGSWDATAPGSVSVRTSDDDLNVVCSKNDLIGHTKVSARMSGTLCASIHNCGGFGFVINDRTGAGYRYPDDVNIQLSVTR